MDFNWKWNSGVFLLYAFCYMSNERALKPRIVFSPPTLWEEVPNTLVRIITSHSGQWKHTMRRDTISVSCDGTHCRTAKKKDLFEKSMQTLPLVPTGDTVSSRYLTIDTHRSLQRCRRAPFCDETSSSYRLAYLHSFLAAPASVFFYVPLCALSAHLKSCKLSVPSVESSG